MKNAIVALLLSVGVSAAYAQVPAGAPAGSTGICKDGTYSQASSKRGACAGHKGVKDWYTADAAPAAKTAATPAVPATPAAPAPMAKAAPATMPVAPVAPMAKAAPAAPAPAAAPAAPMAKAAVPAAPTTAVAGGGNGQVWVNTASKVYHCEGSKYYGKTKAGSYMTESAAIAAGAHGDHGKACKAA